MRASRLRAPNMRVLTVLRGYSNNLRCLRDRFIMEIDEVDNLAMSRRECRQAFPQDCIGLFPLERAGGILAGILQGSWDLLVPLLLLLRNALECRKCF